ncbi:nucleolar protein [Friedmanniomyces endolithicus]|uniref:Nucleolar protein n=1 Tax=Friedmanniomyces endolithicus TaxID=329885 RepID=A0AAN6JE08_9PEZI|nr:nucleolar protein [Friedmanniomyces endolithicus]KAK0294496.1 nucleolar protein [Friedmanniomyces endolithicus]KAK0326651.1 nucleolar protein [Friedmanniomyces endolithicus]KAK1017603.1 nucleolar protein [Friedmanniomyces endolithicus]
MSTQTVTNKRKSSNETASATKKIKTAKSASKPAPVKSALKKAAGSKEEVAVKKAKSGQTGETRGVKKPVVQEQAARENKTAKKETPAKEKPAKDVKPKPAKEKTAKPSKTKATKQAAKNVAEPVSAPSVLEDTATNGAALTAAQTATLIAGFSSSEDEEDADAEDGVAISKLPQVPSLDDVQQRIKAATTADPERTPGVVYVGRIPHGFFEPQMRAYFSQFGVITNMRLARNRKTGKSQHYAFIEFASKAVAEIVAKTMDKYLLFGHIMQVRGVPREQVKENMWDGTGRRKKPAPRNKMEGSALKRGKVREQWEKKIELEGEKRVEKAEKLREMGYEFQMPELTAVSEVPVKPKVIEGDAAVDVTGVPDPVEEMEESKESLAQLSNVIEAPVEKMEEPKEPSAEPLDATEAPVEVAASGQVEKGTKKRLSAEPKTKKAKRAKT